MEDLLADHLYIAKKKPGQSKLYTRPYGCLRKFNKDIMYRNHIKKLTIRNIINIACGIRD